MLRKKKRLTERKLQSVTLQSVPSQNDSMIKEKNNYFGKGLKTYTLKSQSLFVFF